ncbi:MAG: hypothetical protein U9O94_03775 [Nanoarchaeota archaeon]|nr:hypothetical protein [Nanoarchaeota archaeon]
MKHNKKGVVFSVTMLILTILVLIVALMAAFNKTTHEKKIGEEQIQLIEKYQEGEHIMFYIDQAGKYSSYDSIYQFTEKGGYFNEPICNKRSDGSREYSMWENVILNDATNQDEDVSCYPSEKDLAISFDKFFNQKIDNYLNKYGSIPKENYELYLKEELNSTVITATAIRDIILPIDRQTYREKTIPTLPNDEQECLKQDDHVAFFSKGAFSSCGTCPKKEECNAYINQEYCNLDPCNINCVWEEKRCKKDTTIYSLKPTFKIHISYNFIGKFNKHVSSAKEIRDNIRECLIEGSRKVDDDDLTTCSDVDGLKKEIEHIENYKIKSISEQDKYILLFDIEEDSFNNPYYEKMLILRFGISFKDIFPPPNTKIIGIEEEEEEEANDKKVKYLVWEKNMASDIADYGIYVRSLKPNYIDEIDKIATVSYDDDSKTEWKINSEKLESGQKYWFYIIAKDKAGNSYNRPINPIELTI